MNRAARRAAERTTRKAQPRPRADLAVDGLHVSADDTLLADPHAVIPVAGPVSLDVLHRLSAAAIAAGKPETARGLLHLAAVGLPDSLVAQMALGGALEKLGDHDAAEAAFERVTVLDPEHAVGYYGLARALGARGEMARAIATFRRAVALGPDEWSGRYNFGVLLTNAGRPRDAIPHLRRAVALAPTLPAARHALSTALLAAGELEEGWREARWCGPWRQYAQSAWDGRALEGRTILLYQEHGLGDTLQLCRYVPLVVARGGRVILEVQQPLVRLLGRLPGAERVVLAGEPLPPFDTHDAVMSLPARFGITPGTIPRAVPYLAADAGLVADWRARLGVSGLFTVGLTWAGNLSNVNDVNRSVPLAALAPLTGIPGVRFVGVQKGPAAEQAAGLSLENLGPQLGNLDDTAALVSVLDLVISVDTSVAHLAGALGVPTWLLLSTPCDWRWELERESSPWYPSMRLFRQERPRAWAPVVERVAAEIARLRPAPRFEDPGESPWWPGYVDREGLPKVV